jgi:hypothetical protein
VKRALDPARRTSLLGAARSVLDANWTGRSTVPSRDLYPHQWSWDSAFVAIGRSWEEQERAQQELRSLFAGQWPGGKLPHIVFNPGVPEEAYFPGPDFWQSRRLPDGPQGVETSGITQPPLHARAALTIYRRAGDPASARAFLEEMYPNLVAQHRYLAEERDPLGIGLAALVHPWESGLDNSPAWDALLDGLEIPAGSLPPYRRRDLAFVDAADRPVDATYDRFVYLAAAYRETGYDDARIAREGPFLVAGPLFNAIFGWSSLALAEIADELGEDGAPHRQHAQRIREAMLTHLWDADDRRFYTRDLRAGRLMAEAAIINFVPLLDPGLPREQVEAIVADLGSPCFHPDEAVEHYLVPSYDLHGHQFDRRR